MTISFVMCGVEEQRMGGMGEEGRERGRRGGRGRGRGRRGGTIKCLLCVPLPQVEGLLEDVDFRTKVTREKFEELCSDLFDRVPGPVEQALEAAGMTMVRTELCVTL